MSLKKTAVAIVLGFGFAAFAQANRYQGELGELSFGNPLSIQGDPGSASGNFSDWFTFTVASDVLASDTTAEIIMFQGSHNFDVQDLEISVYKGSYTGNNIGGLASYELLKTFSVDGSGTVVSGLFDFDPAWADYTFLITGNTTGASALYSFGMTAAIPEPAEYAMLLAGLGVVGMAARRRKMKIN